MRSGTYVGRLSPTVNSVLNIVGIVPGPQMGGVYADGPVAGVQDKGLLCRNRIVQVVDQMGGAVGEHVLLVGQHQSPVPRLAVSAAGPVPAALSRWLTGHVGSENLSHGALWSATNQRIAVFQQATVVRRAQRACLTGLTAVRNRAGHPEMIAEKGV